MTQTSPAGPAGGPGRPATGRPDSRPDVVLILVDDMGYSDIGCFGSEIRTPHLDALAAEGVRLTQFYNGARCCPTRASLLTGRYAHQAGIGHMVRDLGHPAYQGYLNDECVTIAEALQPAGYRTVMAGKWHVGGQWTTDPAQIRRDAGQPGFPTPLQRGFQRFFGTLAGAGSYFNPHTLMLEGAFVDATDPRVQWGADETADGSPSGFYYTDAIGRYAAGQIAQAAADGAPLFLYAAYTAPHWPLHALPEDLARYRGRYREGWDALRATRHARLKELGVVSPDWPLTPRDSEAPDWDALSPERRDWEDARMAAYAAQVEAMDRSVGRIVAALRDAGRLEQTLLLFLSDNGGCAEFLREDGTHGSAAPLTRDGRPITVGNREGLLPGPPDTYMSYDLPWANASNTPFRRYKHWVHEGGIATPLIAHWPAGTAPEHRGGLSHSVGHLIDVLPTILDATATPYPQQRAGSAGNALPPPEGESLVPLLARSLGWQRQGPVFWEHEGNRAVRSAGTEAGPDGEGGRWKLVSQHPGPWELYDMRADRTELRDLSAQEPQRAQAMAAEWEAWAARCGVQPWEAIRPGRPARSGGGRP